MTKKPDWVVVHTVQGTLTAEVYKSHLESEGIPVFLRVESAGRVFGLSMEISGEVGILVPAEFAEEARQIIQDSTLT